MTESKSIENFVEDNQYCFFKLLFSDVNVNAEWYTNLGSDPNKEIIRRLDSGDPKNISELFLILEKKIEAWECNPETKDSALFLKQSILSYKTAQRSDQNLDIPNSRTEESIEELSNSRIFINRGGSSNLVSKNKISPTIPVVSPEVNFDRDKNPDSSCLTKMVTKLSSLIGLGGCNSP